MANWVNFQEVRKRVPIEAVLLQYYRLDNLKRDGTKLSGPCPVHNGNNPRSFSVDTTRDLWHCFTKCQGGGNQLDLVAKKEDISIREAALKLQAFFCNSNAEKLPATQAEANDNKLSATRPKASKPEEDHAENPPLTIKLDLKPDHPHLIQDRGLKVETIRQFGIGYCSRGILRGTIAIPIHDEEDTLVAYAGRRLKPTDIREFGKFKLARGFKKEIVLYNLNRAKTYQKEQGLILVEGFFSVVKLYEFGIPNVVAAMGCELSDSQVQLLREAKEVIVLFDGDDAGRKGAERAQAKLTPYLPVRLVRLPDGTEPEDFSPKALRWLINGMTALDLSEVSFLIRTTPAPAAPPSP